ncbi:MAG: hypothetical protein KDB40_14925, partial [Acidimicrobiales bacterium]|nr:hypothetical protein [Acidimicrobiales bacterium]
MAATTAALTLLAACGGGSSSGSIDAADRSSDPAVTTAAGGAERDTVAAAEVLDAAVEVDLTSFELATDLDEIWAATGDRAVCSPAEPAAAQVRFAPGSDIGSGAPDAPAVDDLVVAMLWWETPAGEIRRQVLTPGDDAWAGAFGPTRARRAMTDTSIEFIAVGFDAAALARLGLDSSTIDVIAEAVAAGPSGDDGSSDAARAAIDELGDALGAGGDVTTDDVVAVATVAATSSVTVLAPEPCAEGQVRDRRGRSQTDDELTVELSADAADGVELWATSDRACSNGDTTFDLIATTTGRPTGVRARWTLPTGATGETALRRTDTTDGIATWTARLGSFEAPRSMPEAAELPVSVVARDADGDEAVASTVMVVRRPVACESAAPGSTGDDGTNDAADPSTDGDARGDAGGDAGDVAASVSGLVASGEIWATAEGRCASGATSVRVEARTTGPVTSVEVRVVRSGGSVVDS